MINFIDGKFVCPVCGRSYNYKKSFGKHVLTHTNDDEHKQTVDAHVKLEDENCDCAIKEIETKTMKTRHSGRNRKKFNIIKTPRRTSSLTIST